MNKHTHRKTLSFILLALTGIAFTAGTVFAQNTGSTTGTTSANTQGGAKDRLLEKRENAKANLQEKRADLKTNVAEKKEELKDKREAITKEVKDRLKVRMKGFIRQIEKRLRAAIERMEKIAERIASRIEKLKANGIDTAEAETYLGAVKTDIADAKTLIEKIPGAIGESLLAEEMRKAFENVKTIIEEIKKEIRSAHENAKKAIESLRNAVKNSQTETSATSPTN